MDAFIVPPLTKSRPETNITDLLVDRAAQSPDRALFSVPESDGTWADITSAEFLASVSALAKGFIAAGIASGDRVGIMSKTRYEWTLIDFALWFAGAIPVPVYETSSPAQVQWNLGDSGAIALFAESQDMIARFKAVESELPALTQVWCIDDGDIGRLGTLGLHISDSHLEQRRRQAVISDIATIIYTSGTTGRPKGCVLTHANFVELSKNAALRLPELLVDGSTLLFVTLAHVFARFISVLAVYAGVRVGHEPNTANVGPAMQGFHPSFLLAVPRVFEKVYNAGEQRAESQKHGPLFRKAAAVAVEYSKSLDTGGPSLALRAKHALYDALVYRKVRAAMGGKVEHAISGSARLGDFLGHFYRGIGVVVLEGYGLTETTAPATVNTPDLVKIGTVGRPLPGVGVKIADDGEILITGIDVFERYWHNDDATSEAFTADGWFRSGDIGRLDDEGFLTITGRKKEIIVTAGGKNVAPAVIEDAIRSNPIVSQVMVVGDGRPFIAAIVTLDREMLPLWLANNGEPAILTIEQAAQSDAVLVEIERAIVAANQFVSRAESVRKFVVITDEWSEHHGELTPSMKIKRALVTERYAELVNELYADAQVGHSVGARHGILTGQ